ncbi:MULTISPECIES: hypothetical protein [unclassified Campylobacter]|uniref:hypothetical protein n=1 Tax=unclassified Campylobacter TaxID=2593542 RepID=UPI001237B465|nr:MULTISPECIES: hypothetical protein [unclassified Campylobacter]KAA6227312.1 hypothetical protein FMM57_05095 [Campylobacter sp. LR286c]KAA6227813.1 hypothetical protein FMM54_01380 [Campylobacter sp. LR185c]KAA6228221.1 hypothetical protein FMM55_01185 [Campylobacter sp. LR196d]KAA6229221.1 hypothetical protein FMM58_07615 [Campylobacter sp. LR291e]KAA6231026.1 hypothetical protein FMM56_04885 [Campylobacter sp. LR264d]
MEYLSFPNFPTQKQEEITKLYHNLNINLDYKKLTLENFNEVDNIFCENAGIYDLDKSIKYIKRILNSNIEKIINDENVNINF